jgi:hypothetical protein
MALVNVHTANHSMAHNQQVWNNFRIKLKPSQAELERYENYKKFCQEHYDYAGADEQVWANVVKSIREY